MVKIKGWICALVCVCLAIACAGCGEPDAAVSSGGGKRLPTAQYENGFEEYERPEPEGGGGEIIQGSVSAGLCAYVVAGRLFKGEKRPCFSRRAITA